MSKPPASDQLRRHQRPHHYKSTPEEEAGADRLLERLAEKLAKDKGITLDEARNELRHLI